MIYNVKEKVAAIKKDIQRRKAIGEPKKRLLIIQVGDDMASNAYIKGKLNDARECGFEADLAKFQFANDGFLKDFILKNQCYYDGVIVQSPLPCDNDFRSVVVAISDKKDVDGLKMFSPFIPATPRGIMEIINDKYEDLNGVTIAVVGRGEMVGRPLLEILNQTRATVIACNSATTNLAETCRLADVIVTATGKPGLITRDFCKDGAFVIDAGISYNEEDKICGDVDKNLYEDENVLVTPVPGGVGLMTRIMLMKNLSET